MARKDYAFVAEIQVKTKSYLERVEGAIERELDRHSDSSFHGPLKYALEGGKRIRPLVLLLAAESVGCTDDSVLDAAVAVELLHAGSIIQDDIIDRDSSRRGRAAFHKKYGEGASLLTVDFLFFMILSLASRYDDRRVADALSTGGLSMCEGVFSEMTMTPEANKVGSEKYLEMISKKTASLFETAGRLGGMIGGAQTVKLKILSDYSRDLGIAFQLHDDLQDLAFRGDIRESMNDWGGRSVVTYLGELTDEYAKKAKENISLLAEGSATALMRELTEFSIPGDF